MESGGDGESLNSRLEFHNSEGNQWANMISGGVNLVMTVIGFAVSTMFIVFVCTRLVCARIQLNASRRSFPVASRSDLSIVSIFSYLFLSSVVPCLVTAKAWDCRMENIVLNILFPNN